MMQPKKNGRIESAAAHVSRILKLPENTFPGVPYAELHGDSTLHITGYEKLVSYDPEKILFCMKRGFSGIRTLCVEGDGLLLTALRPGCLSVSGRIRSIGIGHGEGGERDGSL